jgi:class 3 adenylate cyclase
VSDQQDKGVVTLMFTDVEGSTGLSTRLGDEMARELIETQRRIVREQVAQHDGRVIDTIGDGFMVSFVSTRNAVNAALGIQEALRRHEADNPEQAVRLRIGLNVGEVLERGAHPFGGAVNATQRVMAAAAGGQILAADTVRQLAGTMPGVTFRDRGRHRLKGFDERWRLHEVVAPSGAGQLDVRVIPRHRKKANRRTLAAIGVGAVLTAVGIGVGTVELATRGRTTFAAVAPNSVAVVNPGTNSVVRSIPVGDTPTYVAVGAGAVWVLNSNAHTLSRIDPQTKAVFTVGSATEAVDVAAGARGVWVTSAAHTLTRIDPSSYLADPRTIELPGGSSSDVGSWVAAVGNAVWATSPSTVTRIKPTPRRSVTITDSSFPSCCNAIALGGGSAWVTAGGGLWRVDLDSARKRHIDLPFFSQNVTYGAGAVWLTDSRENTLWRIDPSTSRTRTITVGDHPAGVAVGAGSVWVASADGAVSRIDPNADKVVARISVGSTPRELAVGGGAVWVSVD